MGKEDFAAALAGGIEARLHQVKLMFMLTKGFNIRHFYE